MNRGYNNNSHPAVVKQQYDAQNVWNFENKWRHDLCNCQPCGRCCFACFCACCMGCKLAKRVGETPVIGCCVPCTLCYVRTKLRTARRIDGSCCGDLCQSFPCCASCSANQLAHELDSQGLWDTSKTRKTHPRNDRQPYGDY